MVAPQEDNRRIGFSLVNSLLFHVLFLAIFLNFDFLSNQFFPEKEEVNEVVETRILSPQEYERIFGNNKVVESVIVPDASQEVAPDAFAGERNQTVEEQMKAEDFGSVTGKEILRQPLVTEDNFGTGSGAITEYVQPSSQATGILRNGTMDILDDSIAYGPTTLLNTREYKYASFYNRLKQELGPRWETKIKNILRLKEDVKKLKGLYKTETVFTMDKNGKIIKVKVSKSSGYENFDEAAFYSLHEIPTMQNLPKDLQEENGNYELNLGFIVQLENGGFNFQTIPDQRLRERYFPLAR